MILLAREVLDGRSDQLCFGAIDLSVRRNAFGRQIESFEADLQVSGLAGGPMHAVFIRAPVVEHAGPGVQVLASLQVPAVRVPDPFAEVGVGSDRTAHAMEVAPVMTKSRPVVCREGRVTVAAFHPELAGDLRLHQLLLRDIEGD
jgi:5'-phosphate synthase pdxT subunit